MKCAKLGQYDPRWVKRTCPLTTMNRHANKTSTTPTSTSPLLRKHYRDYCFCMWWSVTTQVQQRDNSKEWQMKQDRKEDDSYARVTRKSKVKTQRKLMTMGGKQFTPSSDNVVCVLTHSYINCSVYFSVASLKVAALLLSSEVVMEKTIRIHT